MNEAEWEGLKFGVLPGTAWWTCSCWPIGLIERGCVFIKVWQSGERRRASGWRQRRGYMNKTGTGLRDKECGVRSVLRTFRRCGSESTGDNEMESEREV